MPLDWKPKQEFFAGPHAKPWAQVTETETFKQAITAALLHTMINFPKPVDMGTASANDFRRQGATMALHNLMNLSHADAAPRERDVSAQNLDHKV